MRSGQGVSEFVRAPAIVLVAVVYGVGCDSPTESPIVQVHAITPTELSGSVGADVTPAPTVRATDEHGMPMAGVRVSFQIGREVGAGRIANGSASTDAEGVASVGRWTLGTRAGRQIVTARGTGFAPVEFAALAAAGPPSRITSRIDYGPYGLVGTALPGRLYVVVSDGFGNSIAGVPVTFTVTSGGGSIEGSSGLTPALSGVWTLGPTPGIQEVTAHVADLTVQFRAFADTLPGCAPDCGRIAFVSSVGSNSEIYSVNWDGTDLTRLTDAPGQDEGPAWSPDGQRIAFVSDREGSREVYVMNADGSGVVRLTSTETDDAAPSWSPDGTRIVFTTRRLEPNGECALWSSDLWVVGAATGDPPPTLLFSAGELSRTADPSWSPDGTRIALVIEPYDANYECEQDEYAPSPLSSRELFLIDPDGSGLTVLTRGGNEFLFSYPSWSPSGDQIAVRVNPGDAFLWQPVWMGVMRSDGSGMKPVSTTTSAPHGSTSWSPDGELIAVDGVGWFKADGSGYGVFHIAQGWDPDWRR
jgi:TolB protein